MKSVAFCYANGVRTMLRYSIGTVVLSLAVAACQTPYPQAPVVAATPDYDYHIGPLDTINVIVWRNPELSMSVPVRPDGKITTPLVDDLPALARRLASSSATWKRRSSNTFAIRS
jgi:protein involved in polysaccharide export with SLBB domain